jgi:hypothetical protein
MIVQVILTKKGPKTTGVTSYFTAKEGFRCQEVVQCPVDVMFCAQSGIAPSLPFLIITARDKNIQITRECIQKALETFPVVYAILLFPSTISNDAHRQLQLLLFDNEFLNRLQLFPAFSIDSAIKIMLTMREKLSFQNVERVTEYYDRVTSFFVVGRIRIT